MDVEWLFSLFGVIIAAVAYLVTLIWALIDSARSRNKK